MDQLAGDGVPKHVLVFGNVAPIPVFAGKLDGIPGGIAVDLGTGRPHLLADVGGILGPFGNWFDLDVVVDANPPARLLLSGRRRRSKGEGAGVTSAEGSCFGLSFIRNERRSGK